MFGNPNLHSQTPPTAARTELQKNLANARMRDFLARKRKSRDLQLGWFLQDRRLSVFSNDDKVAIMAHAKPWAVTLSTTSSSARSMSRSSWKKMSLR